MPQKLNKAGKMQDYIPAGNGDPSGEYGTSKGTNKNFTTSDKKKTEANVITENKSVVVENKGKTKEKPFDIDTLDVILRKKVENGEITLKDASKELAKAGWYNFIPSEEETKKALGIKGNKANVIDGDLSGKSTEKIEKLNTPELKEKFKETLKKAVENARKAEKENNEDGGTANLDSCEIYLKNANLKQLEEMVKSVDPKLRILKWDNGVYHIFGYEKGQGNLNTRMVEAFEKTLYEAGFKTYVYSQMD